MPSIEKDPERLSLAIAYVMTASDLQRAIITLKDNMRRLSEAQQKLLAAAAVSILERELIIILELAHHHLTPIKERDQACLPQSL